MKDIFELGRPHPNLMKLYVVRSLIFPPITIFWLPYLYFRYKTLRYHFDEEGVRASWGILFRREISLSYGRIQDIHLASGMLQRWLGLADIHIQTASGAAAAEMTIEGLLEFEAVRDFLYLKMRGARHLDEETPGSPADERTAVDSLDAAGLAAALAEVTAELAATRRAVERLRRGPAPKPTSTGEEG